MIMTDVANYLATKGHGTVDGDIFRGQMHDSPDVALAVNAYGGAAPDDSTGAEYPKVQVEVRDVNPLDAYSRAYAVMEELHGLLSSTLGTTHYYHISADSSPIPIGKDPKGRFSYTVNFSVFKEMD